MWILHRNKSYPCWTLWSEASEVTILLTRPKWLTGGGILGQSFCGKSNFNSGDNYVVGGTQALVCYNISTKRCTYTGERPSFSYLATICSLPRCFVYSVEWRAENLLAALSNRRRPFERAEWACAQMGRRLLKRDEVQKLCTKKKCSKLPSQLQCINVGSYWKLAKLLMGFFVFIASCMREAVVGAKSWWLRISFLNPSCWRKYVKANFLSFSVTQKFVVIEIRNWQSNLIVQSITET